MFDGFAISTAETGEVEIAFATAGQGPPVLLLRGYPQCKAMWARVAPLLIERFTVVCSDLRGYGDSSKPAASDDCSNYSFRAMANDQLALMQALGHQSFHIVGHDRGGRVAHRLALDHPSAVSSLTVLDIVPTSAMFGKMNSGIAQAYWHWFFLGQPSPLPERVIGLDPDLFHGSLLTAIGGCTLDDLDREILEEYRRCWRNPATIHAFCADYRATRTVGLPNDVEDSAQTIGCPSLVGYAELGKMAQHFDIPAEWRRQLRDPRIATFPGGHFFVDQHPTMVADVLGTFLASVSQPDARRS